MEIDNKVFSALPFTYVYVDSLNEYKLCSDARLSSKINTNDMNEGTFISDDIVNSLIENIVSDPLKKGNFIFDGYVDVLSYSAVRDASSKDDVDAGFVNLNLDLVRIHWLA